MTVFSTQRDPFAGRAGWKASERLRVAIPHLDGVPGEVVDLIATREATDERAKAAYHDIPNAPDHHPAIVRTAVDLTAVDPDAIIEQARQAATDFEAAQDVHAVLYAGASAADARLNGWFRNRDNMDALAAAATDALHNLLVDVRTDVDAIEAVVGRGTVMADLDGIPKAIARAGARGPNAIIPYGRLTGAHAARFAALFGLGLDAMYWPTHEAPEIVDYIALNLLYWPDRIGQGDPLYVAPMIPGQRIRRDGQDGWTAPTHAERMIALAVLDGDGRGFRFPTETQTSEAIAADRAEQDVRERRGLDGMQMYLKKSPTPAERAAVNDAAHNAKMAARKQAATT